MKITRLDSSRYHEVTPVDFGADAPKPQLARREPDLTYQPHRSSQMLGMVLYALTIAVVFVLGWLCGKLGWL